LLQMGGKKKWELEKGGKGEGKGCFRRCCVEEKKGGGFRISAAHPAPGKKNSGRRGERGGQIFPGQLNVGEKEKRGGKRSSCRFVCRQKSKKGDVLQTGGGEGRRGRLVDNFVDDHGREKRGKRKGGGGKKKKRRDRRRRGGGKEEKGKKSGSRSSVEKRGKGRGKGGEKPRLGSRALLTKGRGWAERVNSEEEGKEGEKREFLVRKEKGFIGAQNFSEGRKKSRRRGSKKWEKRKKKERPSVRLRSEPGKKKRRGKNFHLRSRKSAELEERGGRKRNTGSCEVPCEGGK